MAVFPEQAQLLKYLHILNVCLQEEKFGFRTREGTVLSVPIFWHCRPRIALFVLSRTHVARGWVKRRLRRNVRWPQIF